MENSKWVERYVTTQLYIWCLILVSAFLFFARVAEIDSEPTRTDFIWLLFVLFLFHVPTLLLSTFLFFWHRSRSQTRGKNARPRFWSLLWNMLKQVPLVLVLLFSFGRVWTFESIGFALNDHWIWAIVIGVSCSFLYMSISGYIFKLSAWLLKDNGGKFSGVVLQMNLPRGKFAQGLQLFDTSLFSPVFEEIVYRGFFVYLMGNVIGSPVVGVLIGLLLFVWVHLYLGPSKIIPGVIFFLACAGLLYSPFGLLSVIAFHITWNARYAFGLRAQCKRYMESIREYRQTDRTARIAARREEEARYSRETDAENQKPDEPVRLKNQISCHKSTE